MERKSSIIGIPVMLILVYLFYLSGPSWDTSRAAAAIYSVIGFLFVTLTAAMVNITHAEDTPANRIFSGIAGYSAIIFVGAAVFYSLQGEVTAIHSETAGIFLNLVAYASSGILVFLFSQLVSRKIPETSIFYSRWIGFIITVIATTIFVIFMVVARMPLPTEIFLVAGYITGLIAVTTFFGSAAIIIKKRTVMQHVDPIRLTASFVFFGLASINHLIILPSPSINWILTMGLTGIALMFAIFATVFPHLHSLGVESRVAYIYAAEMGSMVVAPFLAAYYINGVNPGLIIVDPGLSILIHFSAAMMAFGAAYGLYSRLGTRNIPWRSPLITLMLYWFVAEIYVAVSSFSPLYAMSESGAPYIMGAIASTILLVIAYRLTLVPRKISVTEYSKLRGILVILLSLSAIILVEVIHIIGGLLVPEYMHSRIAMSLLFVFNFIALYALLNFSFVLVTLQGKALSLDTVSTSFATVWIIVGLLRANFTIWTIGWWMSNVMLIMAACAGAIFVLHQYAQLSVHRQDLEERLEIQRQLLSPELCSTLELVSDLVERGISSDTEESRLKIISKSLSGLSRTEILLQGINAVFFEQVQKQAPLRTVDTQEIIKIIVPPDRYGCEPTVETPKGTCLMSVNGLLIDAIQKLLDVILNVGKVQSIAFVITPPDSTANVCDILMKARISTEHPHEKQELLQRYTGTSAHEKIEVAYANRILALFNCGFQLSMEARDDVLSVELRMTLPSGNGD